MSGPVYAVEFDALPGLGIHDEAGIGGEEFVGVGEGGDVYEEEHEEGREEGGGHAFEDRVGD